MNESAIALARYISGNPDPEETDFTLTVCCNDPKITETFDPNNPERSVRRLPDAALAPYRVHARDYLGRDYYLMKGDSFVKSGETITGFTIVGGHAPAHSGYEGTIIVLGGSRYGASHFGLKWVNL